MSDEIAVVSSFSDDEECADAIRALHQAQVHEFRAFSPFPSEKIIEASQHARGQGRSLVRFWVLAGGITGILTAIAITFGTSWEWNLYTGGKPVASTPPYIIIMFELMILIGGLSGLTGFFFHSRLPVFEPEDGYRSRFAADKFGLVVRCGEGDVSKVESILRDAGAEDLQRETIISGGVVHQH